MCCLDFILHFRFACDHNWALWLDDASDGCWLGLITHDNNLCIVVHHNYYDWWYGHLKLYETQTLEIID